MRLFILFIPIVWAAAISCLHSSALSFWLDAVLFMLEQ